MWGMLNAWKRAEPKASSTSRIIKCSKANNKFENARYGEWKNAETVAMQNWAQHDANTCRTFKKVWLGSTLVAHIPIDAQRCVWDIDALNR
eukprot:8612083-Karenia_brevis.AAC.1